MKSIPYPDFWHLESAHGWLMLGNPREAARDLERIHPRYHAHPHVAEIRCRFLIEQKKWTQALDAAATQVISAPDRPNSWIYFAFCLHELRQTKEAWEILTVAAKRFPKNHLIASNLACYACHLREFKSARRWVRRALKLLNHTEVLAS